MVLEKCKDKVGQKYFVQALLTKSNNHFLYLTI